MTTPQEREFVVDGHRYRAGRLDAFQQLDVASQWRDALLGLAFAKKNRQSEISDESYRDAVFVITTGALGHVTKQSRDEITRLGLSVVQRQQKEAGRGWSPVLAPGGGMMFQDMELPQIVQILYEVFDHNRIVDFFSGGPSDSQGPKAE